jgi:hypothetical protein
VTITIDAKASEMIPRSEPLNVEPLALLTRSRAGTEPTPTKTRNAVPRNSEASFCHLVFSSMPVTFRVMRSTFDNVE